MSDFHQIFKRKIAILDGGLGTTLDELFHKDISHPLWSAKLIHEDEETIIQAHLSFLRAGARVILTSTYQCAFETFERAGYTEADAKMLMLRSISLANEARRRFCGEENDIAPKDIQIALSLGPFGATLSPTQEFDGFYPPPYGPKGYTSTEDNLNSFNGDLEAEEKSEEALAWFHLQRLRVFASHLPTWSNIDCVAFETIPLAREVRAIRKAMTSIHREIGRQLMKPWWISFVFPDGQYPERLGGCSIEVQQIVKAALMGQGDGTSVPDALGINCTRMEFLDRLLTELGQAVECLWRDDTRKPWLVIYPNGGDVYDVETRTWRPADGTVTKTKHRSWAENLDAIVRRCGKRSIWDGFIVGGCCRTGPDEIHALHELLPSSVEQ